MQWLFQMREIEATHRDDTERKISNSSILQTPNGAFLLVLHLFRLDISHLVQTRDNFDLRISGTVFEWRRYQPFSFTQLSCKPALVGSGQFENAPSFLWPLVHACIVIGFSTVRPHENT